MKKVIFYTFVFLIVSVIEAIAQQGKPKFCITPRGGFFKSKVEWSIAGNIHGQNPNILSELIWKDLKGIKYGIETIYNINNRTKAILSLIRSDIFSGTVNDTDYLNDDRQDATFQETYYGNKGNMMSVSGGISYSVFKSSYFDIITLIGYDQSRQGLHLLDFEKKESPLSVNSTYDTKWEGGLIGVENIIKTKKILFIGNLSMALLNYNAKANWNLIEEFSHPVSFEHFATAYKMENKLAVKYLTDSKLLLQLVFESTKLVTKKGLDKANYQDKPSISTQLNRVRSTTRAISLGMTIQL